MAGLKYRLGTRLAAGILCAAVALSSSNLQAFAADSAASDIAQEETDSSASVSSVTSEDFETTEDSADAASSDDAEDSASEQQTDSAEVGDGGADSSTDSAEEDITAAESAHTEADTASSDSGTVTASGIEAASEDEAAASEADETASEEEESSANAETSDAAAEEDAEEAETHTITGFVGLSDSESSVTYYRDDKPTEAEVIADLPATLEVYLDGESESTEIPVTWESPADYDNSEFYWYEFDPVWDEDVYTLDCDDAVPYINVHLVELTVSASSVSNNSNEEIIFEYLVNTAGFSVAAACGILANIYVESAFNCNAKGDYDSSGNYTSYGLCQWHSSRFTSLKNYCSSNGLDYTTVEGQLAYLVYELQTSAYKTKVYDRLMSVSDDADGAYWAAYYWCYYYEIPANYASVAVTRGTLAMNYFWTEYQEYAGTTSDTLKITGVVAPTSITAGKSFTIGGTITSSQKITKVTAAVYNTSGTKEISSSASPNTKTYSLKNSTVDNNLTFSKLTAGVYTYKVTVTTSAGTTTLVSQDFVVLSTAKTVANGNYYLYTKVNTSYGASISGNSSSSGANVQLAKKDTTNTYMQFKFTYQSNGYYLIQDVGSGKYLTVSGTSSGSNVKQSSSKYYWYVLPDGTGSYYLVPKTATTMCLYVKNGTASAGQNIQLQTAQVIKSQRWTLTKAYTPATISGASKPGTLTAGSAFTIKGTISSSSKITSVTVAVYDTSGTKQIGKTVSPNATSYSLSKVDSSIKFGSLSAGVYRYKVTAKNSYGTTTLVNKVFVVLSTGKTVTSGTYYYITSKVSTSYCLGIKSSSSSSGANVQLAKKSSSTEYQKFKFIYQSSGYYKIQDVGSGKYLAIESKSSGANVKQSSTATLWQVLPDGTGSYYLVPKGATTCCLYLNGGTASSGTNIKIKTASISKSQRWTLKKTYKAATISGATKPGTLTKGSSFTIKGTISSETKITSVTVAVYDSNGKKKIGKTVSPNTKTYSLSKVDSSIKFGTLSKGTYTYKVTATNSAGKKTLISKTFTVK